MKRNPQGQLWCLVKGFVPSCPCPWGGGSCLLVSRGFLFVLFLGRLFGSGRCCCCCCCWWCFLGGRVLLVFGGVLFVFAEAFVGLGEEIVRLKCQLAHDNRFQGVFSASLGPVSGFTADGTSVARSSDLSIVSTVYACLSLLFVGVQCTSPSGLPFGNRLPRQQAAGVALQLVESARQQTLEFLCEVLFAVWFHPQQHQISDTIRRRWTHQVTMATTVNRACSTAIVKSSHTCRPLASRVPQMPLANGRSCLCS